MPFLMPCEPGSPRLVDPAWERECSMLRAQGHRVVLADHDLLQSGNRAALRHSRLDDVEGTLAWRGWMLHAGAYALMEELLAERDISLLDGSNAYEACHHAPGLMEALLPWQARSFVLPSEALGELDGFLLSLPQRSMIIKDWVKSEAGLWNEACYIPDPHDLPHARRVVGRFLELRGSDLVGGVLFREWQPLLQDAAGRAAEWRCFVVDGQPVLGFQRTTGPCVEPPGDVLREAAAHIPARWATLDWALSEDSVPLLLEAGYGGVSGVPEKVDPLSMLDAVAEVASAISRPPTPK